MTNLFFVCPHCDGPIMIDTREINCAIFRHGVFKSDGSQIDPHLPKEKCDLLKFKNLIYGCGKPFQLYIQNNTIHIKKCDYI
jgi:hypothetical protein